MKLFNSDLRLVVALMLLAAGTLSAVTINIELKGEDISHSYFPGTTFSLMDGTVINSPPRASDSIEFVSSLTELDLVGVSVINFLLTPSNGQRFLATPSVGFYNFSFNLGFSTTNSDLILGNFSVALLSSSEVFTFEPNRLVSSLGPSSEFELLSLFPNRVPETLSFDGLSISAEILSTPSSGTINVNYAGFALSNSAVAGSDDPAPVLRIVPEPSTGVLILLAGCCLLSQRHREQLGVYREKRCPSL